LKLYVIVMEYKKGRGCTASRLSGFNLISYLQNLCTLWRGKFFRRSTRHVRGWC